MTSGIKILAAWLIFAPIAAHADSNAAALATVMNNLASVRSSTAHFTEEKYLSSLTEPLESQGTIGYIAPDHLEKITTAPEPESLSVTGDELDVIHNDKPYTLSLSDHPEIQIFVESIRSTLSGNLPALEQYYDVGFSGTAKQWHILLQPNDTSVQEILSSISIDGAGNRITKVETIAANGDRSDMTITP